MSFVEPASEFAVFVCVTAPSEPGLPIRTEIDVFEGAACVAVDWAAAVCWSAACCTACCAAAWAPLAAEIACDTAPLSPGLSMRTEMLRFDAAACAAFATAAAAAAGSAVGAGVAVAAAVAAAAGSGVPGVSACAGTAKPSATVTTAAPTVATLHRDPANEIVVPPLSTVIQQTKYPSEIRTMQKNRFG